MMRYLLDTASYNTLTEMFICEKCGHQFPKRQGLTKHLARLRPCDAILPHKCGRCGKSFTRSDTLQRHEKICAETQVTRPKTQRLTIMDAQEIARTRGGECLDQEYTNNRTQMGWRCIKGHEWNATFNNIKDKGSWCPKCAPTAKKSLQDAQVIAQQRGGECISEEYINTDTPLIWLCHEGHEWKATLNNVKDAESWCPKCAPTAHLSIRDAQKCAEEKGGTCPSSSYVNNKDHLQWRCGDGHEWWASLSSVRSGGTWCPHCYHKNESEVRGTFEYFTGESFPQKGGLFPQNPLWRLDGYCKKLGIAFEYHGEQHYEYSEFFHRNRIEDFEKQQARDREVELMADMLDEPIVLIVIPYWLTQKERIDYIWDELCTLGVVERD